MATCPDCEKDLIKPDYCSGCGWKRPKGSQESIDLYCPFNDHGQTCGKRGSISEALNGSGPWWCSEHYWKLKGQKVNTSPSTMSYRERWYAERGLPYEPPKLKGSVKQYTKSIPEPGWNG